MILIPSGLLPLSFKNILIFIPFLCFLPGCGSEHNAYDRNESSQIDSLIKVRKLNDRAILVNFGYDAVSAIKTEQGIVVIDAGISTGLTAKYKKIIRDEFKCNNFIYVINTHGHHDHCRGNSVFTKSSIVGHINCLEEISLRQSTSEKVISGLHNLVEDYDRQLKNSVTGTPEWNDLFTQKARCLGAYNDASNNIPWKKPDITFSDSLKIDCGDTTFEMIYFGKCHSTSDILIYVPELKLLFTGDLFSQYGRLNTGDTTMTDKNKWKQAANWIEKRHTLIDIVIEGHGAILSINDLNQFIEQSHNETE